MKIKDLTTQLVEISKQLKDKKIKKLKRYILNKKYDKILKKIRATF